MATSFPVMSSCLAIILQVCNESVFVCSIPREMAHALPTRKKSVEREEWVLSV